MNTRPDFARTDLSRLEHRDLAFLVEHFPQASGDYSKVAAALVAMPNTVENMLDSEFVTRAVLDKQELLLNISPFLLFSVLLRQALRDHRGRQERQVINYLANLLTLYVSNDRLYKVSDGDEAHYRYIIDLLETANQSGSGRRFMIYAQVGNYSLFLAGLFDRYLAHRQRYHRRPIGASFYADFGRTYYQAASEHGLARQLELQGVFSRLSLMFDRYTKALNQLSRDYIH